MKCARSKCQFKARLEVSYYDEKGYRVKTPSCHDHYQLFVLIALSIDDYCTTTPTNKVS